MGGLGVGDLFLVDPFFQNDMSLEPCAKLLTVFTIVFFRRDVEVDPC